MCRQLWFGSRDITADAEKKRDLNSPQSVTPEKTLNHALAMELMINYENGMIPCSNNWQALPT